MNTREAAYAAVRRMANRRKEQRRDLIEKLREDETFDRLYRQTNSLKWDCVLSKGEHRKEAEDALLRNQTAVAEWLSSKGYSEAILTDTETCASCHDTGVCNGRMCACTEAIRQTIELDRSPLLKEMPSSLQDVDVAFYGAYAKKFGQYVEYLQKATDKNYYILFGKTGTGKTYLAGTAVKEAMVGGASVLALNSFSLNKIFLAYHCAKLEGKASIWEEIAEPDVLLIDDLGSEQLLNNVTVPYLFDLLTERLEQKTFITTNYDPRELEMKYGQRILSRLLDKRKSAALPIEGDDFRFKRNT